MRWRSIDHVVFSDDGSHDMFSRFYGAFGVLGMSVSRLIYSRRDEMSEAPMEDTGSMKAPCCATGT